MDPYEFTLLPSDLFGNLPRHDYDFDLLWDFGENPPQNQQFENEQLELEQPELRLNLTPGQLLPTSPSGLLEQNRTPCSLPTLPPLPLQTPPLGPLEQNLSTWQQEIQRVEREMLRDEDEEVGVVGTREGETELDKSNSGCLGHEKSKENIPGGEGGNNKTIDVRIASPLEDVSQKGMVRKEATKDLNEGFPQLNFDTLASDQVVAVTVEDFGIEEVEMCLKSKENDGMSLNGAAEDVNGGKLSSRNVDIHFFYSIRSPHPGLRIVIRGTELQ